MIQSIVGAAGVRVVVLIGFWEFYILATSEVISEWIPTCGIAHSL